MVVVFFIACCNAKLKQEVRVQQESGDVNKNYCIMTVFVHGTVGPHFSFKAIGNWVFSFFKRKKRKLSPFQRYIEQVKQNGFHRLQPIDELGLHPIDQSKELKKSDLAYIGQQTVKLYKKVFDASYLDSKDDLMFYTFNWSGRLSKRLRGKAAGKLYGAVYDEAKRLHKLTGKPIKIWLLGHSHGANVILNLEKEALVQKKDLVVDKAVFFGGPVQTETETFVNGRVFKKIYHIFSRGDHIQRIDFVSTKDWFSRQTFGSNKKKPICVPKNVNQIEVVIGDHKPFHYELWLWGRKRPPYFFYRKDLSIHPLPLSIFSPAVIAMVDALEVPDDKKTGLYFLNVDGNKGVFDLRRAGLQANRTVDIDTLRGEGLAVL